VQIGDCSLLVTDHVVQLCQPQVRERLIAMALWITRRTPERRLAFSHRRSIQNESRAYRSFQANVLHQAGHNEAAATAFSEAEALQRRSTFPFLNSVEGFLYCDLLLDQRKIQEVKERAAQTLEIARGRDWPLPIALDNLSLGRAWLLEAQQTGTCATTQAAEFLQRAVDGLRQAGQRGFLPHGLLARAALHRFNGDYERAERDLSEVLRIATRGPMGLHLADYHLESARLHLAQDNQDKAREHWETAKTMIERMGYRKLPRQVYSSKVEVSALSRLRNMLRV
jgi:tetratricopeptide (TPR) repeat protein